MRTVGVEEEFLLLGARPDGSGPGVADVLRIASYDRATVSGDDDEPHGSLVHELKQQQVEANSAPHASMDALGEELLAWRRQAASAAERVGMTLVASGTSPCEITPRPVRTERYDRMSEQFGALAREQLCCGCHVHVQVASLDEAAAVMDRIRVWLPVLLALSANSPFYQGEDTAYVSYRSQMWGRWPGAGPIDLVGSADGYRELVESVVGTGVLLDEGMVYFDARYSEKFSTVEIRVADVCLRVEDAVLIAALCRALVETAARESTEGIAAPRASSTLIALAKWRAARWGVSGDLLDPATWRPRPAGEVVATMMDALRPALLASGDLALVEAGVQRIFDQGTGAAIQRGTYAQNGSFDELVALLAR
ncbi:MAG: carboxylate-amine ligase, partial [Marmoricola sp.]